MNMKNHPFFENSVRCFFPLAAFCAVLGPAYLVCVLVSDYSFEHPFFNIFEWHAYEMLFGFLFTLIAGFLLTAGGHWTGKDPLTGWPLVTLFFLWFVDKVILFAPMNKLLYLIAAALFPIAFICMLWDLLKSYKQFWSFIGLIVMLSLCKLLYLYAALFGEFAVIEFAMRATIWVILVLVAIIGGRIIPRFTKNFFELDYDLKAPKVLEIICFVALGASFLWTSALETRWPTGAILIITGLLNLGRVYFFLPFQAIRRPFIGTLHIGYSLVAFGLIYMGFVEFYPSLNTGRASLHLLVTGGFSLVAINVMVRASLGHTGRELKLTPAIAAMFFCVAVGAFLRTFIPPLFPQYYFPSLHTSMGFWTLGFLIYLIKFLPIMLKAREK